MIDIIIGVVGVGLIADRARRRGTPPIFASFLAVMGYVVFLFGGNALIAPGAGLLTGAGWLALFYVGLLVVSGGGRRIGESWRCPDCTMMNDSSTIVCPCGYRHPGADAAT